MTDTRRQRAHETETAVARYLAGHGWPYAMPAGAGRGGADVTGVPGLLIEVKARRDLKIRSWLKQASGHARGQPQGAYIPAVIWRPDGAGPVTVHEWPVMMRLDEWARLLRLAGYGQPEGDR